MSKVIKDNNGVAIVEGTPAASLIKDADKFFAAKIDTRMAGEAIQPKSIERIAQAGKIDTRPGKGSEEAMAAAALTKPMTQMIDGKKTIVGYMLDGETTMFNEAQMNLSSLERADLLPRRVTAAMQGGDPRGPVKQLDPKEINTKVPTAADLEQMNNYQGIVPPPPLRPETGPEPTPPLRPETGPEPTPPPTDPDAILARNLARDFKRQRSAKEAERSQKEKDATKGRFISTLRR